MFGCLLTCPGGNYYGDFAGSHYERFAKVQREQLDNYSLLAHLYW